MLAFKGFTKDLTCIRGGGIFQYEPGVLYTADRSKCASTGFHCTENPLECLDWYALGEGNRYFLVEAGGSLDEDGWDAKISCTEICLLEELSLRALVFHGMTYMVKHPLRSWEKTGPFLEVKRDKAEAKQSGAIAIARGASPMVRGVEGAVLGLMIERDEEIKATRFFTVPGQGRPDVWYTLTEEGRRLEEVKA